MTIGDVVGAAMLSALIAVSVKFAREVVNREVEERREQEDTDDA